MRLYTINSTIYPNTAFKFTLTTTNLQLAPSTHRHNIANVNGLSASLAGKAVEGHSHTQVFPLYVSTPQEETTSVTITASAVSGANTPTVTCANSTVTIHYDSPKTNRPLGVLEKNPQSPYGMIQLWGGWSGITDTAESTIVLEDTVDA